MSDFDESPNSPEPHIVSAALPISLPGHNEPVTAKDFRESFGEEIRATLDLGTWRIGSDLEKEYIRIEREVRDAVERETDLQHEIRKQIFPRLRTRPTAPKNAGEHQADQAFIERIHRELLFRGGMEACDGVIQIHETLPLTIYQLGVSLVSYSGSHGTWSQRLFRKDLQQSFTDRVDAVLAALDRRDQRSQGDGLGELVRKALLDFAERAILLKHSQAPWLMGHGNPVTYELLTGGGNLDLMVEGTHVLREFVERRQQFVFVANEPRDQMLLTIGQALRPLEYAVVRTLDEQIENWLHQLRFQDAELEWDEETISATQWIPRFIERVASKIAVCMFRATQVSPAQVFYCHVDHTAYAAHMVLADSVLQEQRGFPMLADMARGVCASVFADNLAGLAESAYAAAGAPWRYAPTRVTR
jgi:hypothetical protein